MYFSVIIVSNNLLAEIPENPTIGSQELVWASTSRPTVRLEWPSGPCRASESPFPRDSESELREPVLHVGEYNLGTIDSHLPYLMRTR